VDLAIGRRFHPLARIAKMRPQRGLVAAVGLVLIALLLLLPALLVVLGSLMGGLAPGSGPLPRMNASRSRPTYDSFTFTWCNTSVKLGR